MASKKIETAAPAILYAGKLPSTKKPGETVREKLVRRCLRAAKALDACRAKPTLRDGELEGWTKKYDGTLARLRDGMIVLVAKGEDGAPANEFEKVAFELAGIVAAAKPAKPAKKVGERRRVPAAKKPAKVEEPAAEAAAETATAE